MKVFGKNLVLKKRSNPISEKETFCDIVDMMEENIERLEKLHGLGLDLINYEDAFYVIIESLMHMYYGEWKTDIISWYLYERKDPVTGEIGLLEWENQDTGHSESLTITNSEELWDTLVKIETSSKDDL